MKRFELKFATDVEQHSNESFDSIDEAKEWVKEETEGWVFYEREFTLEKPCWFELYDTESPLEYPENGVWCSSEFCYDENYMWKY